MPGTVFTCPVCKIEFRRPGRRKALCCSLKCKNKWTSLTRKGVPNKTRKGVYRKCETCGKENYVYPGKISSTGRRYCNMKCRDADKHFFDRFRGENNHSWKGGKFILGGYRYILSPDHPNVNSSGYVAEHRLVMEKELSRFLTKMKRYIT